MNTPNGVTVQLFKNGLAIEPTQQGYFGTAYAGDEIEMRISLQKKSESGNRILITTNRERENAEFLQEVDGSHRHIVPVISPVNGGKFDRDDADRNCVHLVEMSDSGLIQVTNIVVSAQDGEFFLVFHPTYRAQAYKGEMGIAIPGLWIEPAFPALVPFVESNYRINKAVLPPVSEYVAPTAEIDQSILDALPNNNHMVVKFWSVRTGTGGAVRKDGELVKIYWKNLNVADRCPRHLLEGETVLAQGFRPTRGNSRMAFEAMGITRVEFEAAAK